MRIIDFDESNVVNEMMKVQCCVHAAALSCEKSAVTCQGLQRNAEEISFEEFKEWSTSQAAPPEVEAKLQFCRCIPDALNNLE